ncbi:TetR/AcrR family transcriptional regulator [Liberiplasma polymorphum]|uniref:TetR/AcrR family transcriptional regulator n=1 Tax=Liberiplasma polymorphum TaxID=3374570 RepID=UPI003773D16C
MNGFERRTEAKKYIIKKTALKLFKLNGVKKTKIEAIAEEAQVSQVSIYNYFNSKENLFHEVIKDLIEDYTCKVETIVKDNDLDIREKFKQIIQFELEALKDMHDDFLTKMYDTTDSFISEIIETYTINRTIPAFKALINQGKEANVIKEDIAIESILVYIGLFSHLRDKTTLQNTKMLRDLIYLFFYGIGGKHND